MTIFDVIRYPISDPPTQAQLTALPEELYRHWIDMHTVDWARIVPESRYDRNHVGEWMRRAMSRNLGKHKEVETDLAALRRLIEEYNT